jgi:hypothetical protein
MSAALSVPVLLVFAGTEVDLGTVEIPTTLTIGQIAGVDPVLPITVKADMIAFRAGLVAMLREAADRIEQSVSAE